MSSRTDLVKMGKHIQEARKNKKYTQKELGEIIDVSHKTISKWEQGHIAPDITILKSSFAVWITDFGMNCRVIIPFPVSSCQMENSDPLA